MPRLSEEFLAALQQWSVWGHIDEEDRDELVRGYRREAVLEAMLREWADAHGPRNTKGEEPWAPLLRCMQCGGIQRRVQDSCEHADDCLVARTEALLGEVQG